MNEIRINININEQYIYSSLVPLDLPGQYIKIRLCAI